MASSPQISILMSVRNGKPYVAETVVSIIDQTFSDWEFVIVDNASTDGSADLIDNLARHEPRIRLIRSESDLGHSGGLNRGLAVCRGEWIARIDADDVALPNRLERQLAFVAAQPNVKVSSCLAHYINAEGRIVGKTFHNLTTRQVFDRYMREGLAIGILHPGAFIDRTLLARAGGYRGQFDPANDIDLWARLCEEGALILVQPEYLMKYRVHSGSISSNSFKVARLKYQWARNCMRARRSGLNEPDWEEFLAERQNAPWWKRLNRWRKTQARRLYRQSAQHHIIHQRLRAVMDIGLATLLQPTYTVPRLRGQAQK